LARLFSKIAAKSFIAPQPRIPMTMMAGLFAVDSPAKVADERQGKKGECPDIADPKTKEL